MTFLIFLIFPTREVVESLCKQLEYYAFKTGDVIVRQGEEGDHLFVLEAALDLFGCQLGSLIIFNWTLCSMSKPLRNLRWWFQMLWHPTTYVFLNKIWPVLTELICQAGNLQVSINGRDYNVMGPGCEAGAGKEHGKDGEENSGDPKHGTGLK